MEIGSCIFEREGLTRNQDFIYPKFDRCVYPAGLLENSGFRMAFTNRV